jgi:hypothetical protein
MVFGQTIFFNSLLRAGSKLIGLLLEPVKAALLLLGSGMTGFLPGMRTKTFL